MARTIGRLMAALLSSRVVTQPTQIQPTKGTVEKYWNKQGDVSRQPGVMEGVSLHVTRDILTGPMWGATNANAFITISGLPPSSPIVAQIASIAGSNAPQGGKC